MGGGWGWGGMGWEVMGVGMGWGGEMGMGGMGWGLPAPQGGLHPAVPAERIGRWVEEQRLPLSLIGASYSGVSVNDCIASAKAAVGRLLGG